MSSGYGTSQLALRTPWNAARLNHLKLLHDQPHPESANGTEDLEPRQHMALRAAKVIGAINAGGLLISLGTGSETAAAVTAILLALSLHPN